MNERMKQKWIEIARNRGLTLICGLLLVLAPQAARADSLSGTTLSGAGSKGGFFFAPGTATGDLSITVTGCPSLQLAGGCSPDAGITGSTTIGGTAFTWEILPSSANFTPCSGVADCWNFGATTTGTEDWLIDETSNPLSPGGGGLIAWSSITDVGGVITLSGTATGTDPTGAPVDDPFSVSLGALNCTNSLGTSVTPCSLSVIADSDPIYGTASFASGEFGSTSGTVPEPSALILLGFGVFLTSIAVRKRPTQQSQA